MKGCKSMYKYNKVTQQKKFHLLTLVLHQKLLIKQAAKIVGINYSTAKTIMFFNRNLNSSYQFSFQNPQAPTHNRRALYASYKSIPNTASQDSDDKFQNARVIIINTIGSEKAVCRSIIHHKKISGNYTKSMRDQQDDLSEQYINEQKLIEAQRPQRPRTRSQSNTLSYICGYRSEAQQKRDIQSSGLPQIEEV